MTKSQRRKLRQIGRAGVQSAEERVRRILDERTERLAGRAPQNAAKTEPARVLVCGAGRERCGLPLEAVMKVIPYRDCVPVPDGPPALVGILGHGGHVVSVIDLGTALGLTPLLHDTDGPHLIMLRREQPRIALRVERAYGVSSIAPLAAEKPGGLRSDFVSGHAEVISGFEDRERVLSLIDLDRLLRPFLSFVPSPGV